MQTQDFPTIVRDDDKVRVTLSQMGLSKEQISQIARSALSARAEYLEGIDPKNAPGQKAYMAGVRQLRLGLLSGSWKSARFNNIEMVVNHELGLMLGFQNVDMACQASPPRAISERGPGTRDLVARSYEADLFQSEVHPTNVYQTGDRPVIWFVCVAATTDSLQVEVSRPKPFDGDQFDGFFDRIYVLDEKLDTPAAAAPADTEGLDDIEINISKKANGNS